MNLDYFKHFLRSTFPEVTMTNEEALEVGIAFKEYLEKKFIGKEEKLLPIWDIDPKTIVMNQVNKNPFTVNGYHPALVIHFTEFVKQNTL